MKSNGIRFLLLAVNVAVAAAVQPSPDLSSQSLQSKDASLTTQDGAPVRINGDSLPGVKTSNLPPRLAGGFAPMFTEESMPPVSTTLHCIINLSLQYFCVYTILAIVRTLNSFRFKLDGVQQILETGCTTVTYAPMLCVLFLGARMRAIQLTQGETEKYQLPQPWVQRSMVVASTAVFAQVVLVVLVSFLTGMSNVPTDEEGNLDVRQMSGTHPLAVKLLTILRYIVMAMLYGGFSMVVIGVLMMRGPKEIWGEQALPVSPAVMCTILLSGMFFLVYLLVAIVRTCFELCDNRRQSKALLQLEASAETAKMTVNFAPMLCILFIAARMRALQIDPRNGNPQSWAQKSFFICTFSILVQALLVILLPFMARGRIQRGKLAGDIAFHMENPTVGAVMTAVRYFCLMALYGGIFVVIYSVYTIQHPNGRDATPRVSPAMHCVITLTVQYFLIYIILFMCITGKSFLSGGKGLVDDDAESPTRRESGTIEENANASQGMTKAIAIFENARSTVMFAPMLSILFMGARMRSVELTRTKNGSIPQDAGPQKWVQDGMFLATWSVFVQLIMALLVPMLTGAAGKAPAADRDRKGASPETNVPRSMAIIVEVVRYTSLLAMYGGAVVVVYGVFTMTPNTLPPYNGHSLVPGLMIPEPPVPVESNDIRKIKFSMWK